MRIPMIFNKYWVYGLTSFFILYSCNVIEKSSIHEFNSGYYKYKPESGEAEKVYLEISNEQVSIYKLNVCQPVSKMMDVPLTLSDSILHDPVHFTKRSIDIDITTIPFKYRFAVDGQAPQLNVDFNAAIFVGRRYDKYHIHSDIDPFGKSHYQLISRAYDFGVFLGFGSTLISPFTTSQIYQQEYNGMVIQYGLAVFLESKVASFGLAGGLDYLMSPYKDIWIYQN
jgi:hypothetical protein